MALYQALLLGVVQGVTEFLPISSSGHLILFQQIFNIDSAPISFSIALHFATLCSILIFFRNELKKIDRKQVFQLFLASIPILLLSFIIQPQIEALFSNLFIVAGGFFISSLFLLSTKVSSSNLPNQSIKFPQSLIIGIAQAIAILPGASRSGLTISTGINLKIETSTAFTFSFLLSIPAIVGAMIYETSSNGTQVIFNPTTILGMFVAFATGLFSLQVLKKIIIRSKFYYFGFYCLIIGLITLQFALS